MAAVMRMYWLAEKYTSLICSCIGSIGKELGQQSQDPLVWGSITTPCWCSDANQSVRSSG